MATVEDPKPPQSRAPALALREVGTKKATRAAASTATGSMAQKMAGQLERSKSQPPTTGPKAIAAPALAPQAPMA